MDACGDQSAAFRVRRSEDFQYFAHPILDDLCEPLGQVARFRPQPIHAGLLEQIERGAERRHGQDRRIGQLPGLCARGGMETRLHAKPALSLVAPPALEAG